MVLTGYQDHSWMKTWQLICVMSTVDWQHKLMRLVVEWNLPQHQAGYYPQIGP